MHAVMHVYKSTCTHTYTNSRANRRDQAKQLCSQLPLGDYMGPRNMYDEFSNNIAVNIACVDMRLGVWALSLKLRTAAYDLPNHTYLMFLAHTVPASLAAGRGP